MSVPTSIIIDVSCRNCQLNVIVSPDVRHPSFYMWCFHSLTAYVLVISSVYSDCWCVLCEISQKQMLQHFPFKTLMMSSVQLRKYKIKIIERW